MVIIAVLSPVLGTMADFNGRKKAMLGGFLLLGSLACAGMFFIYQGEWLLASVLFILANIGANGSYVFYDSLLPHIARDDEVDRVSTAGYALGYIGGRPAPGAQPGLDQQARLVRAADGRRPHPGPGHAPRAAGVPLGRGLVAGLLDPAVPPRAGAEGRRAAARISGQRGCSPSAPPSTGSSRPVARWADTARP